MTYAPYPYPMPPMDEGTAKWFVLGTAPILVAISIAFAAGILNLHWLFYVAAAFAGFGGLVLVGFLLFAIGLALCETSVSLWRFVRRR